ESKDDVQYIEEEPFFSENILDYGYLYSLELKKEKIKYELSDYFSFGTMEKELDFLCSNIDLAAILPYIAGYIKKQFDSNANFALELMDESDDWKTLFINVYSNLDWKTSNDFLNRFYDLLATYPELEEKLNINIIPDEF
ncbi:MAG: hypothetical protein ACOC1X_03365, partial [Promethearchaeota archaeon]